MPRRGSVLASQVVGRHSEITALNDLLGEAALGQGTIAFVVGEAGIGKSRLTKVTTTAAEANGLPVLRGRAVPTPAQIPYRPLAEALCSGVRSGLVSDEPELRPFRSVLGWLVPEWRVDAAQVVDPVMALSEAVLRFLRVVAGRRGCVVLLEDLHWADTETLRVIEYLADNVVPERVLCLATLRDEERSAGLDLARTLHARRVSSLFQLSRLGPHEVAQMVGSCLDVGTVPDPVLDLAARAEGVPFLVEELLAVAVASGALVVEGDSWSAAKTLDPIVPLIFSDSMRRRLVALGEHAQAVLRSAAVLGRRFDWTLLPTITGLSEENVLTALRDAVDAHIVAVDPGEPTFRFRHALSRDAVLTNLLPPEVAALSRRALEAVEAAHPDLEEDWCQLAAQLAEGAGDLPRSARLLLHAGRRALQSGALTTAESTLDRAGNLLAADDPAKLDVDECLSHVLSLAGKRGRAVEVGASLLARLGDDQRAAPRRAEVYLRLARAALAATHSEEAYDFLEHARVETAAAPERGLAARVDALRAQTAMMREPQEAPRLAQAALDAAEQHGLYDVACEALEVLGRSKRRHDLNAAEAAFARALRMAEAHGLTLWLARALHELGTIDMLRGGAITRLEQARDLAVVQGALANAAVVDVQIAAALAVRDDPEPAAVAARRSAELARRSAELARRSAELARRYGWDQTLAAALALEAHVHARAGRRSEMDRCIQAARSHASDVPDIEAKTSFAAAIRTLRARGLRRQDPCGGATRVSKPSLSGGPSPAGCRFPPMC